MTYHKFITNLSQPPLPDIPGMIKTGSSKHAPSQSTMTSLDRSMLSPTNANSFQRRSAIHTNFGKSPVSLDNDDRVAFDYNVFVTTWQDQIKMRQVMIQYIYCVFCFVY